MSYIIITLVQAAIVAHLFPTALCQFPIQFPFPQMGAPQPMVANSMAHMPPMAPMSPMGPMATLPQLAPQPIFPQPMPMAFPMQRKMPSVVMPYHAKSADRRQKKYRVRRRKPKIHESWESDDYSESSSAEHGFRRSKTKRRRQVLTPVVSYVTKDGYVVYQKKIKKDKAKDWLEMTKKNKETKEVFSSAEERQFQKMLKYKNKKRHQHH